MLDPRGWAVIHWKSAAVFRPRLEAPNNVSECIKVDGGDPCLARAGGAVVTLAGYMGLINPFGP